MRVNLGALGGSGPPGRPSLRRVWWPVAGAGRAEPRPMACPWLSVTVRHQAERGLRAAAARFRTRPGSVGPVP